MNEIQKLFYESVTTRTQAAEKIAVKFINHSDFDPFTLASFEMLTQDPATELIISVETGEVLYIKQSA